ncbi:MAG: SCO family protein [Burkholderiales bacterium]|nr:SCO family protein [Burkholderiales bacterium]
MSVRAALGSALAALVLVLAGCDRQPAAPKFDGIDITGAAYAHHLDLPDTAGRLRHLADFKGKVVVVFFGYTQCPDVCPTTMLELAQAKQALGADGARVQGIFVTIDPARDTPAVLQAYVRNFSPDFIALRGDDAQTQAAAKEFKVFYAKVPGDTPGSYTLDHTAGSYVFDPEGRVRLFTRYGAGVDSLVHDLKLLLAGR